MQRRAPLDFEEGAWHTPEGPQGLLGRDHGGLGPGLEVCLRELGSGLLSSESPGGNICQTELG